MSAYIKRTERSQINDLMLQKTRTAKTQNKQKERNKLKNPSKESTKQKTGCLKK
jgi:hypothetical protein